MSGQINIRLTPEERTKIKVAAAASNKTVAQLVKKALCLQYGIRFDAIEE